MPNWCTNRITFEDRNAIDEVFKLTKEDVEKIIATNEDADASEGQYSFQKFKPQPAFKQGHKPVKYNEHEEVNWYNWNTENWGTKWDMCEPRRANKRSKTLHFNTAWSPPVSFYEDLAAAGYNFVAYYYEPGCGFKGKYVGLNGSGEDFETQL